MIKFKNTKSALRMILAVVVIISSALPLQAAMNQNFSIQETEETLKGDRPQLLALSWGDIWNKLRRKKSKKGSRGPNQLNLCMIAPADLQDPGGDKGTIKMWGTKPVFLWEGKINTIEVRHIRSNELIWGKNLEPGTNSIIYQGESLKPGEDYIWQEKFPPDKRRAGRAQFRIMKKEERDRISEELKQLESNLKAKDASQEKIVLARSDYFAQKGLWSDVLREIYSVQNPSPEFKEQINKIENHDFCSFDKDEQKVGLVSWK